MSRTLHELLVKIIILHFSNHIFETENYEKDFEAYIGWNKGKKLENLDTWIHSEKVSVLKKFFLHLIQKYQWLFIILLYNSSYYEIYLSIMGSFSCC